MAEPFRHTLRVRYAECDMQGVVFNAHYLAYIDDTITALWRETFGGYQTMLDRGVDIVVAAATQRFRGGATFDEQLVIEARVTHMGTTSLGTGYHVLRGDELLLEADLRHVWVRRGTAEKTPMPDWAREALGRWS